MKEWIFAVVKDILSIKLVLWHVVIVRYQMRHQKITVWLTVLIHTSVVFVTGNMIFYVQIRDFVYRYTTRMKCVTAPLNAQMPATTTPPSAASAISISTMISSVAVRTLNTNAITATASTVLWFVMDSHNAPTDLMSTWSYAALRSMLT